MIMAYWNGMKWEVSNKQISYLEALTTSYSIDTDTNADKEGQKPTENVGLSLMEISFNTTYRIETGTSDIRSVLEQWKSMIGVSAPLIIGGSIFGPDRMQLQSVNVSNVEISPKGTIRAATCAFKLKEFAEEPVGVKNNDSGSGTSGGKSSKGGTKANGNVSQTVGVRHSAKKTALSVGAVHADKSKKKTLSIK